MKYLFTGILLFILPSILSAQKAEGLIISNVSIVDVVSGELTPRQTIIIKGNRILSIVDSSSDLTLDYPVIDGSEKYIIPGLIDSHVHTTAGPPSILKDLLVKTLSSGVTLVRDMGGDVVVMHEWVEDEKLQIPSIFTSAIFAGKSWINNDRRALMSAHRTIPGTTAWLRAIDDSEKVEQYVDDVKNFGIDGIKVYADLTANQLKWICKLANAKGIPVYAHATVYPATPLEVVGSGVLSVSHSERLLTVLDDNVATTYHSDQDNDRIYTPPELNDDRIKTLLAQMKENNVALDATLLVSKIKSERSGAENDTRLSTIYDLTKMAYEAGVTVLAGTDFMISPQSNMANLHEELSLLVEKAKLSNIDALRAATINPSNVFQLEGYGHVAVGKIADLVLLNSSPLEDIKNTRDISLIIKDGSPL